MAQVMEERSVFSFLLVCFVWFGYGLFFFGLFVWGLVRGLKPLSKMRSFFFKYIYIYI